MSHIMFCVDKRACNETLCAYCTNISEKYPDIVITINSYDNQSKIENFSYLERLSLDLADYDTKGLFCITDKTSVCRMLSEMEIAYAALRTNINEEESLRYALYCIENIEEIECEQLIRIWQRFRNIPWKICETERTVIREQMIEDIDRLYEIYSDPSTVIYMEDLYKSKDEELLYMKDYISNQYKFCEYGIWAIEDKKTGKMIGRAGISQRAGYDELEVGYVIAPEYRCKGYCTEVLNAIITYMTEYYGIESLIAFTREENVASISVLNKLLFSRCDLVQIDGKDHAMYRRILT